MVFVSSAGLQLPVINVGSKARSGKFVNLFVALRSLPRAEDSASKTPWLLSAFVNECCRNNDTESRRWRDGEDSERREGVCVQYFKLAFRNFHDSRIAACHAAPALLLYP